jgi:hypothetical protein
LQRCEAEEWRAIGKVEGRRPRLMSYAYTAATLDATMDVNPQDVFVDEVAHLLIECHERWSKDIERSLLETKALILRSLYRYLQMRQLEIDIDPLEKLRQSIEKFSTEIDECQNEQEKIESLSGTLFWREAEKLSEKFPNWVGLASRLKIQAQAIRQAFSKDRIWDTENGSWGYNDSRTGYLTYTWLSYWNYVWAGEKQTHSAPKKRG